MSRPDGYTCEDAERATIRAIKSADLIFSIDTGSLPISHYSSGETTLRRDKYGRAVKDKDGELIEDFVSLPILKDPKSPVKGLRFGACFAEGEAIDEMKKMGLSEEAQEIVDLTKLVRKR